MDHTALLALLLYALLTSHSACAHCVEDTLWDDEDSTPGPIAKQKGMFTFELKSTLGCSDWQSAKGRAVMNHHIEAAVVLAVRNNCDCNFTEGHIDLGDIECSDIARDRMFLSGEISDTRNVTLLLQFLEDWCSTDPELETEGPLEVSFVSISVTILEVTTQVIYEALEGSALSESGSGDLPDNCPPVVTETTHPTTQATPTTDVTEQEVVSTDEQLLYSSSLPVTVSMVTILIPIIMSLTL